MFAIEVDTSITAVRVEAVLKRLADLRGLPRSITVDNEPEFEFQVLDKWAYRSPLGLVCAFRDLHEHAAHEPQLHSGLHCGMSGELMHATT